MMPTPSLVFVAFLCTFIVNTNAEQKIVGGTEAEPGSYPYQVALLLGGSLMCGGSLVDKDWVLSAARCCGAQQVLIGAHDLSDSSETRELIDIEWQTPHPKYDCMTFDNDYMMIKLKKSSIYTPVALDDGSSNLAAGDDLVIMGWGTTSSGGVLSDELLEATTDYMTNAECSTAYSNTEYGELSITDNMMCAARTNIDACQGDSGGPIVVKSNGTDDLQVGVVSWGIGCADPDFPGVYARVSEKIKWINNEIASGTAPSISPFGKLLMQAITGNQPYNRFLRN